MTPEELLAEIAKGRTFAERLPLYVAAMTMSLLTVQQIKTAFIEYEVPKPPAKKPVAKKTAQGRMTK